MSLKLHPAISTREQPDGRGGQWFTLTVVTPLRGSTGRTLCTT